MAPGFSVKDDLRDRNCDSRLRPSARRIRLMSAMGLVGWTNQTPLTTLTRKVATNCCHVNGSDWKQVVWWLDVSMPDEWWFGSGQKIDPMRCDWGCSWSVCCCA